MPVSEAQRSHFEHGREYAVHSRVVISKVQHETLVCGCQRAASMEPLSTWGAASHCMCLAIVISPAVDSFKELEENCVLPLTLGL